MFRHTRSDSQASGQRMPEVRGRRHGDGEQLEDEFHLAVDWSHRGYRSYGYGQSKVSLRPVVPPNEDEIARIMETAQRQARAQAKAKREAAAKRKKRKPRLPAKFNSLGLRLHYRPLPAQHQPEPVGIKVTPPKSVSRNKFGSNPDPRLTGESIDDLLSEYL